MLSHLRNFFKFLFWSGKTKRNLASSLCASPQPRTTIFLAISIRKRSGGSFRRTEPNDAIGRRNYTMLLLMARLGLHAPEVVAIQLDDIDWRR